MKKPINNKSMLISVFLGLLVALLVLGFAILLGSPEDVGGAMGVFIFFLAVPLAAAMVNFFAWKTRKKALALVAAITYTVGILSIVSAVICYINFARWKTEKPINNKSMLISVILGLLVALPSLVFAIFIGAPDDSSRGIFIFFFAVPLAAAIVNFFAWKTRKKALALVAAITYTVGILSIASAVICYINFARWRKIS
jgi:MFS family permease